MQILHGVQAGIQIADRRRFVLLGQIGAHTGSGRTGVLWRVRQLHAREVGNAGSFVVAFAPHIRKDLGAFIASDRVGSRARVAVRQEQSFDRRYSPPPTLLPPLKRSGDRSRFQRVPALRETARMAWSRRHIDEVCTVRLTKLVDNPAMSSTRSATR